jgi:hypothetical protein
MVTYSAQSFLATLVDSNTPSSSGDFSATIQWGPGLPTTTATVNSTGTTGLYTISGTYNYPAPGIYHPVITVVRTTSNQSVSTTSTANISAPLSVSPTPPAPLTGGLDPLSFPTLFRGLLVTNQQVLTLSGTAEPGASVSLSIRYQGVGDPITIGETLADSNGNWSLLVGPLGGSPFLLYGVASPVANPPTPITLLNGGIPILITNRRLHVPPAHMARNVHAQVRAAGRAQHYRSVHARG